MNLINSAYLEIKYDLKERILEKRLPHINLFSISLNFMKIFKPEKFENDTSITVQTSFEYAGKSESLWFSLSQKYRNMLSLQAQDAFVVALLILAMEQGEDVYIQGSMSEKLYYNLSHYGIHLLCINMPSLSKIKLFPEKLYSDVHTHSNAGAATGFSGGVDSFCVIANHYYEDVPEHFKMSHILFNNVGSHNMGGRRLFRERYETLQPAARELGLPFIAIDSNLNDHVPFNFKSTHTVRNTAVALLLQNAIKKFYYASGFSYKDCQIAARNNISDFDPVILPLLSTETIDCIASGWQYTRVEKTKKVSELDLSYRYLDVCVNSSNAGNCSACWKCLRTLLTFDILGKIENYNAVFDLEKYFAVKNRYVRTILGSKYPLHREILQLAERNKIELDSHINKNFFSRNYFKAYSIIDRFKKK